MELAAIIGKRCKDVRASEARDYIYGFSTFIDYSLRDPQEPEAVLKVALSKNFDLLGRARSLYSFSRRLKRSV